MKRLFIVLMTTTVIIACAASLQAQVLFSDNFDIDSYSYDINQDYDAGVRQAGTLAPMTWSNRPENNPGQPYVGHVIIHHPWCGSTLEFFVYDKRWPDYYGGPYENYTWGSPNHNFTDSGSLNIDVDVDPLGPNSTDATDTHFAAIIFGTDVQGTYAVPTGGNYETATSPGMSFWMKDDGRWSVQGDTGSIASGVVANPKPGADLFYHVTVQITTAGFGTGADALVNILVDGASVYSGTRTGGFANNYVTLSAQGLSPDEYNMSQFDNFVVTAVPEPGSMVALLSGLLGLGVVIRRRK